jgi:hypothetical protein
MQQDAESRNDVMYAPDLVGMFCDRIAEEFFFRWEKSHPKPSYGGAGLSGILTLVFIVASLAADPSIAVLAYICGGVTVLMVLYSVWVSAINSSNTALAQKEQIEKGEFPPETAPLVLARLKWWNHLIVPQNWARHSRIHERKYQLAEKTKKLMARIEQLQQENSEKQDKMDKLPDERILDLAGKINTMAQRVEYEKRIGLIEEELVRCQEELLLYSALQVKVLDVTGKLDKIESLGVMAVKQGPNGVTELVREGLGVLEARRRLVMEVDRISPEEFLELVKVGRDKPISSRKKSEEKK